MDSSLGASIFVLFTQHSSFHKVPHLHGKKEFNGCLRIPSLGPLRWSRPAARPLWTLPVRIPGHRVWEPAHHSGCHLWPPPSQLMYSFLSNLSLAGISFSTTAVPKMLVNLQTHSTSIPYAGCLAHGNFFSLFACLESLLQMVISYDRLGPFVTLYTTWSSWTPASVAYWSWCHFPSAFWPPWCTTWCHSLPSVQMVKYFTSSVTFLNSSTFPVLTPHQYHINLFH